MGFVHITNIYPLLKESGYESIVFNSSIAAVKAFPVLSAYSASKGIYTFLHISISHHCKSNLLNLNEMAQKDMKWIMIRRK